MNAQCDIRRCQFQVILNCFKIPCESFQHNQDRIGQASLYQSSVREALIRDQLGPTEAHLLPKMPPTLQDALDNAQPLGVDLQPVPVETQNQLTQSVHDHWWKAIDSTHPGPHPSSFIRPST